MQGSIWDVPWYEFVILIKEANRVEEEKRKAAKGEG